MKKCAKEVSVIGGADGPTSIFIAGNAKKPGLSERIKRARYKKKRNRVKKAIVAIPHTLEEVVEYMQDVYDATEISKQSYSYLEQRKCLKESLIIQHAPQLLGDTWEIERPKEYNEESLKQYWNQIELRSKKAEEIPDEAFPMDFHVYEIKLSGIGEIQFYIDTIWNAFGNSYSGSKKGMKQLNRISKEIYLYYGVTEADIKECSDRYLALITILCT